MRCLFCARPLRLTSFALATTEEGLRFRKKTHDPDREHLEVEDTPEAADERSDKGTSGEVPGLDGVPNVTWHAPLRV
jgi:hypothetical protein